MPLAGTSSFPLAQFFLAFLPSFLPCGFDRISVYCDNSSRCCFFSPSLLFIPPGKADPGGHPLFLGPVLDNSCDNMK